MAMVLIVEDSDSAAPLEIALSRLPGLRTQVVSNGRDALKLLCEHSVKPAALITDLRLPFVDGFQLISAIRADARFSKLPIVVVSGDSQPENVRRARDLGANAFFAKPYSPAEIRDTLEGLLYAS